MPSPRGCDSGCGAHVRIRPKVGLKEGVAKNYKKETPAVRIRPKVGLKVHGKSIYMHGVKRSELDLR